jgi:hypothetical protein
VKREFNRRTEMFPSLTTRSPQEIRAEKRRAEWEAKRIAEIQQQVADGLLTEEEAKERGS